MAESSKESESADTMPAASSDAPPERTQRSTIPDIAPPFEQRYRLGAELGRGGMGRVVEAFDTQLGRTVALKEVLPRGSGTIDRRFEREVQITARLEHPSIVPLYDAGTMPDGRPFYVMRKVTGRPLDELCARAPDLEDRLALLPNLLAAMDAIAHAHQRGIIHRDLKPGNILVGDNGETVVIDWGLAKVIGEEDTDPGDSAVLPTAADSLKTIAGAVFGTPGFMAPEQARGESLGPSGDVFALGATLYQLLVGRAPIAGKSATEAIESSMQRRITPVAEASPNAPAELVAIVEKALAFEAEDRYANAGGLAEDVRRFTTGQLVAAHRYTTRERLFRFAKRHRAPLSVAALAMVAVAVLAWLSVHRIVVERDLATSARQEADDQRSQVLKANAQLVERADQLLVTRARALVDANPTEALALLKELRSTSARLPDARAIAQAAVGRGVAWGLHAEGTPMRLAVDGNVTHLAEVTLDGTLHVWDLISHRVMYERMYSRRGFPLWIAGQRLLILQGTAEVLEPRSGVKQVVASVPPATYGIATTDGSHVAILGSAGEVGVLEVATLKFTPLWAGHHVTQIEYAPDGSWLAAGDAERIVVLDAAGATIAERTGALNMVTASRDRIAFLDAKRNHVLELDVAPVIAWHDYAVTMPAKGVMITAHYRADALQVFTSAGVLHFADHALQSTTQFDELDSAMATNLGDGIDVMPTHDGNLHFYGRSVDGHIPLPVAMANAKLAGHHGQTRFVAAANGLVLIFDLADVIPKRIPKQGEIAAEFVDDSTLLLWPDNVTTFNFYDLVTGAKTPLAHEGMPFSRALTSDPKTGRIVLAEPRAHGKFGLLSIQKAHPKDVKNMGEGERLIARLTPNGFIAAHDNDPRVLYSEHDTQFRELAKVDGGVQSLMTFGHDRFAALGRSGELIRGAVSGGPLERIHVDVDANAFLAIDRDDHVIVAVGAHLLVWDTTLHSLVDLPREVEAVYAVPSGLVAVLDNNAGEFVTADAKPIVHDLVVASQSAPVVGGGGTWLAAPGNGGALTIVELPSLARWTMPPQPLGSMSFLIAAPKQRRLVQGVSTGLLVYDLPEAKGDLGAWLDDRTNAYENPDGFVSWPWLRP
ncbi:MAG: serine/threonine-protein kinase [Deltaproteobacteria bacterium]